MRSRVASDDAAYVDIAARMAADRQALLQLKAGLRTRLLASPAWNIDRYASDWQAALRSMWQSHCDAIRPSQGNAK